MHTALPHVGGDPLGAAGGALAAGPGEQGQGGQRPLVTLPAPEAGVALSLYPGLPAQRREAVLALARGQGHHCPDVGEEREMRDVKMLVVHT